MGYFDREWIVFGPATGYSVVEESVEGLYLIYCDDPKSVKIGVSGRPLSRISDLNTGSPSQLHLIFYSKLLGKRAEEKLHLHLLKYQRSGEWFDWAPEVQCFLLGLIFGISGVIQISWPFVEISDKSQFICGVDWIHFLIRRTDGHSDLSPAWVVKMLLSSLKLGTTTRLTLRTNLVKSEASNVHCSLRRKKSVVKMYCKRQQSKC